MQRVAPKEAKDIIVDESRRLFLARAASWHTSAAGHPKIPPPTLGRLAAYLGVFERLQRDGFENTSSLDIEKLTGINAAQFRKDLSYFGEFGKPGIGYDVDSLCNVIKSILHLQRPREVSLVGAGRLGQSLVQYINSYSAHFKIAGVYDVSSEVIGKSLDCTPC